MKKIVFTALITFASLNAFSQDRHEMTTSTTVQERKTSSVVQRKAKKKHKKAHKGHHKKHEKSSAPAAVPAAEPAAPAAH